MNRRHFLATSIAALLGGPAFAQQADAALRAKITAASAKAVAFLDKAQKPDGSWGSPDYPAMTALCVTAHLRAPGGNFAKGKAVQTGLDFVRQHAQPDGGIYTRAMGNYNTSICLATLVLADDHRDDKLIADARKFLIAGQAKNSVNPEQNGGWGYESGGKRGRPDLDNTVFALEALRAAETQRRTRELPAGPELDWKAAMDFVSRCQNNTATNKEPWASDDAGNKGGFIYSPGDSPAGEVTTADGKKALRSYGSMTYAGVLSLIYAEAKKDDPRIAAAIGWIQRHWSLEENPGQGGQGLFYYYHVMAKALAASGIEELATEDGKRFRWREMLAEKLLALQKPDGSWASENPRWMEKDPVLVTCYCILALAYISGRA